MLFNSLAFVLFFPIVILLYFLIPYKYRWILLLIASYYFYMCWKAEYIILIILSTVIDYFVAIRMSQIPEKKKRKKWLYLSLFVNLGVLFTFKYFNFFSGSVQAVLNNFNIFYESVVFKLLLPVGISFYTFQTLSYSIDVYNDKIKPEKHFGIFALYVSFFPQLVAGPIERPDRLLPQFRQKFDFDYTRVVEGLRMMLWGFFLKLVIADRLAPIVDKVYNHPHNYEGVAVMMATFFFSFQIFCDFAGYSIIARGAAKVMGYDLMQNFRRPYFARSIREFWQRWHISLSTWFRDYVYIPLGGNRVVKWRWYYNLMVTFVVSGLWHGANWTFVIWGFLHGLYLIIGILTDPIRRNISEKLPAFLVHGVQISVTFILAWFAWIFFRANSVGDAFTLIQNLFKIDASQFHLLHFPKVEAYELVVIFLLIGLMTLFYAMEEWGFKRLPLFSENVVVRWATYVLLMVLIIGLGVYTSNDFIYFQF